jgi:hypothetical protein
MNDTLLHPFSFSLEHQRVLLVGAALALCAGLASSLVAQVDNFDSGSDSHWVRLNVLSGLGGTTTYSFPETATGKGYRLQCTGVAALGDSGAARTFSYQTNSYTDFYAAVDIADWDNSLNQAAVLGARLSGYDQTLTPCPLPACSPGFGMLNGYICNYDANQRGAGADARLNGEFQINHVLGEAADNTLAVAEVTLVPHQPYRLVFTGTGSTLVARLYDYLDLTAPLATLSAQDSDYLSGVSGLIAFSRDNTTSDVTFDNYAAAASDPDASIAPAIRHPVAGTPQVLIRTPVARFTNFHPPATGIRFSATTFSTNRIDAAATKLFLNGGDVSASLNPLPPNGTNLTFQTAPNTLQANTVYAARIELQDVSGTLKSTNTFWFDTFSDAYFAAEPVKTVEAEDYNYTDGTRDGLFLPDPVAVSGTDANGLTVGGGGIGYFGLDGTEAIDYHVARTTPEGGWNEYRPDDNVSTIQGGREEIEDLIYPAGVDASGRPNDQQRQKYAAVHVPEYQVVHTNPGQWMGYSRKFASTNYSVFLRVASFTPTQARLDLINGDASSTNQTTSPLGQFDIPNDLMRINYRYVPLTSNSVPVSVALGGTQTVRLTIAGTTNKDSQVMALNYLLFVPVASASVSLYSAGVVTGPYALDSTATINTGARTITIPKAGATRFYQIQQAPPAGTITGIKIQDTNVVITY